MNILRASFVLVILLGGAALGIGHFQVKERIEGLEGDLQLSQDNERRTRADLRKAEKEAEELEGENETLLAVQGDMLDELERVKNQYVQQRARADRHEADLEDARAKLLATSQDLTAWRALGVTRDAVRTMKDDLRDARRIIDAGNMEREILAKEIARLQYDLGRYEGESVEVAMREGLKGLVVAVNPEWDFVVVDVGEKDGALASGKMMVSRAGKLVGKIQLTTINESQSVANILPGWRLGQVQVGDTVLH